MTKKMDKILKTISHSIELPSHALPQAEKIWSRTENSLKREGESKNKNASNLNKLRDRYLSLIRYCHDAREIVEIYGEELPRDKDSDFVFPIKEIFAPDAHLFDAYANYTNKRSHTGFDFFKNHEATGDINQMFKVLVYRTVLCDPQAALLDSSKAELSEFLSHFVAQYRRSEAVNKDDNLAISKILDDIEQAAINAKSNKRSEDLSKTFNKLMLMTGLPLLKQGVILARFKQIFGWGHLLSPEQAIRRILSETYTDADERIADFSRTLHFIRLNPAFLSKSINKLHTAYKSFRTIINNIGLNDIENPIPIRGGELNDLKALHEVHLLNSCLSACGIPIRFRYITLSNRIFNFVRAFDRKELRVPISHPRSTFTLRQSKLFENHKNHYESIIASTIATERAIRIDNEINIVELNEFEEVFGPTLSKLRKTLSHVLVDEDDERKDFMKIIIQIASSGTKDDKDRAHRVSQKVSTALKLQLEDVEQYLNDHGQDLASSALQSYWDLTQSNIDTSPKVILRRYQAKDSNPASQRIMCLPVSGAYRYLFILHNSILLDDAIFPELEVDKTKILNFREISLKIETAINVSTHPNSKKNTSLKLFTKGCLAASQKQWILAHTLAKESYCKLTTRPMDAVENKFGFSLSELKTEKADDFSSAKHALLAQESLYLSHMCKRAISEGNEAPSRRMNWLRLASIDLYESAEITTTIPKQFFPSEMEYSSISTRQALAAIGLGLEWITQAQEVNLALDSEERLGRAITLLPKAKVEDECIWVGLDVLVSPIEPNLKNFQYLDFAIALDEIIERLEKCYTSFFIENSDQEEAYIDNSHSVELWRYKLLKAYSSKMLFIACIDTEVIVESSLDDWVRSSSNEQLSRIQSLIIEHENFLRDQHKIAGLSETYQSLPNTNPLLHALLAMFKIKEAFIENPNQSSYSLEQLLSNFAVAEKECNRLDPFGFPRSVIRKFKKKFHMQVVSEFVNEYK